MANSDRDPVHQEGPTRPAGRIYPMWQVGVILAAAGMLGLGTGYVIAYPPELLMALTAGTAADNCVIKGNVAVETGERIYHVPGQEFYDDTIITPENDERWFCSEEEAVAAGWRPSRR